MQSLPDQSIMIILTLYLGRSSWSFLGELPARAPHARQPKRSSEIIGAVWRALGGRPV
jgi:hypothetical protein